MSKINLQAQQAQLLAHHQKVTADAQAKADAFKKDDDLAVAPGKTPEQIAARQRTAKLFCEIHLPQEKPSDLEARLAAVDYAMPVRNVDGSKIDMNPPKKSGFLGIGAKPTPQYWVSTRFTPKTPQEPLYAFEYYPLRKG